MKMQLDKDVPAGMLLLAIAGAAAYGASGYTFGTASRMGPGFVPMVVAILIGGLSVAITFNGLRRTVEGAGNRVDFDLRSFAFIVGSLVLFGAAIERLGLVISVVLMVVVGSAAGRKIRPLELALVSFGMVIFSAVTFVWALELPMPVWPWFLR